MRRFNTVTLVRDALGLGGVLYLVMPLGVMFFSLIGALGLGYDTPEYAVAILFFTTTMLWPFWVGELLRDGWGRVVLLLPMERRCGTKAVLLVATVLPVLWTLICAAPVFLLFSFGRAVNWAYLLQWASLQYWALSILFLLHAIASVGHFPGLHTGRSRPFGGWRWGLTLAVHILFLIALPLMGRRMIEEHISLAFALLACGAILSTLGLARLRSLSMAPSVRKQSRAMADYLLPLRGKRSWPARRSLRGRRFMCANFLGRNTLVAACLVLGWVLVEFVSADRQPEVSPESIPYWSILLSLSCYWAIQPAVRALRAVRLLPWSQAELGCRLVSISIGSLVTCVGLLALAVFLVADRETVETCLPVLVGIAGTSSLVIPSYLYGGRRAAVGVLYWVWLFNVAIAVMLHDYRSWSNWSWYPAFGLVAFVLGMFFTWRAAAKARNTLRPAMPAS